MSLPGWGVFFPRCGCYLPILGIFLLTVIACFIGICLFIVPGFVLSLGLSMSLYILRDRPELGVFGSMNASWKMMNGHKTELFLLSLRLVGWFLLCIVTLGVGFIWFYPACPYGCSLLLRTYQRQGVGDRVALS